MELREYIGLIVVWLIMGGLCLLIVSPSVLLQFMPIRKVMRKKNLKGPVRDRSEKDVDLRSRKLTGDS